MAEANQMPGPKPSESARDSKPASETGPDSGVPEALQAELADTKDKLMRALAEQQNIRRQMQRQQEEAVKFAGSQLVKDLLDTLDNLHRAIESAPPESSDHEAVEPLLKGVQATEDSLLATFVRHGVQRIDALGAAFDPHLHHAIRRCPNATAAEGTVVEVLQPGYMLHGRVLRPAMVGVAVREHPDGGPDTG